MKTAMRGAYLGAGAAIVSTLLAAVLAGFLAMFASQPPPVVNIQMPAPSAAPITADPKY